MLTLTGFYTYIDLLDLNTLFRLLPEKEHFGSCRRSATPNEFRNCNFAGHTNAQQDHSEEAVHGKLYFVRQSSFPIYRLR